MLINFVLYRIDVAVTKKHQERYNALILQMSTKPHPSSIAEIKVAVGCVVQLRTLHIVKRRMKNCPPRPRLCTEDLRLI